MRNVINKWTKVGNEKKKSKNISVLKWIGIHMHAHGAYIHSLVFVLSIAFIAFCENTNSKITHILFIVHMINNNLFVSLHFPAKYLQLNFCYGIESTSTTSICGMWSLWSHRWLLFIIGTEVKIIPKFWMGKKFKLNCNQPERASISQTV